MEIPDKMRMKLGEMMNAKEMLSCLRHNVFTTTVATWSQHCLADDDLKIDRVLNLSMSLHSLKLET